MPHVAAKGCADKQIYRHGYTSFHHSLCGFCRYLDPYKARELPSPYLRAVIPAYIALRTGNLPKTLSPTCAKRRRFDASSNVSTSLDFNGANTSFSRSRRLGNGMAGAADVERTGKATPSIPAACAGSRRASSDGVASGHSHTLPTKAPNANLESNLREELDDEGNQGPSACWETVWDMERRSRGLLRTSSSRFPGSSARQDLPSGLDESIERLCRAAFLRGHVPTRLMPAGTTPDESYLRCGHRTIVSTVHEITASVDKQVS